MDSLFSRLQIRIYLLGILACFSSAFIAQGQSPEPSLSIENTGESEIRVVWSDDAVGYFLEESLTLDSFNDWQSLSETALEDAGELVIQLDIEDQTRFFRLRFTPPPLVTLSSASPVNREHGVSVTRETIINFSAPLSPDTTLDQDMFYAEFGGRKILSRAELSSDGMKATLFYLEPLPGSAQVVVTFDGDTVKDREGAFLDVDGDGNPGGQAVISFNTLSLSPLAGTGVTGQVFASELSPAADGGAPVDVPLAGVTITIDGLEETHRTVTDDTGSFTLSPVPAGEFFVHIDGRTVLNEAAGVRYPDLEYYPFVGKAWEAVAGVMDTPVGGTGTVYLPLITAGTLQATSMTEDTMIGFPADVVADNPAFAGVSITVPANSLLNSDGTRGGMVGIAPVAPDRLPGPLPQGLEMPLVITVQTDGPSNFDTPAPVCFPNLPDPTTGELSPPGSKGYLMSFSHDKGVWEVAGGMTVSADGTLVCSDPGVGILQPGWHGWINDLLELFSPPPGGGCDEQDIKECKDAQFEIFEETLFAEEEDLNGYFAKCDEDFEIGPDWLACRSSAREVYRKEVAEWEEVYEEGLESCEQCTKPECNDASLFDCTERARSIFDGCEFEAYAKFDEYFEECEKDEWENHPENIGTDQRSKEWIDCNIHFMNKRNTLLDACQSDFNIGLMSCVPCLYESSSESDPTRSVMTHAVNDELSIMQELLSIFAEMGDLLRPFASGSSSPSQEVVSQFIDLNQLADAVAGGDATEFIGNVILQREEALLLEASKTGRELDDLKLGNAPGYPLLYVATVSRPDGEDLILRGETQPYGQYTLWVPSDGQLIDVVFYDPLTKRVAIISPYLSPGVPYKLPRFNLFPLSAEPVDSDGDGLPDIVEDVYGTDLDNADSDDDGIPDGAEVDQGTNPLDGRAAQTGVVGTLRTPGAAIDIATGNNLAVSAEGVSGVSIMDISNFNQPTLLANLDTPGTAQRVAFSGNLVAVADGDKGLAVIDISDTTAARIIQQVNLPGSQSVAAAAGTAYVGLSTGQVVVVDLVSGSIVDQLSVSDPVQDLVLEGDHLYALTDDRLHVISLLEETFAVVGSTASPFSATKNTRLFVGDGVAYTVHRTGYNTLDVSNPTEPVLITQGDTTQFGWRHIGANGSGLGLAAVGPQGSSGEHDISLYDLTDPTQTEVFVTTFQTPGHATAVSIFNGLAYVADDSDGMQVINYLPYDANAVAPSITLETSFGDGEAESGQRTRVTALVGDDVQVRNVEFYLNGVKVFTDSAFPFEFRFVAPVLSELEDSFRLRARAVDTGGNFTWTDEQVIPIGPDLTSPRVRATTPTAGAKTLETLHAFFNEPMDPATLNALSFKLSSAGTDGQIGTTDDVEVSGGSIVYRPDQSSVSLSFDAPLPDGVYQAVITTDATDLTGNPLDEDFSWTFRVADAVFWISPFSGEWNAPENWSEGVVPGPDDDVIIDYPSVDITITHSEGNIQVRNLTTYELLQISDGTLELSGVAELHKDLTLNRGTILGGTVTQTDDGRLLFVGFQSTFDGVSVKGDLDLTASGTRLLVRNGLTLDGALRLDQSARLTFSGTQTFDNASVVFGGFGGPSSLSATANSTLTLGPAMVIRGKTGTIGWPTSSGQVDFHLINEGLISADTAGGTLTINATQFTNTGTVENKDGGNINLTSDTWNNAGLIAASGGILTLDGSFTNTGTIQSDAATVDLKGSFTKETLGTVQRTGGTVQVSGELDLTGDTLTLDAATGSWTLNSATILGGTVTQTDEGRLLFAGFQSTFDGVSVNGDLDLTAGGTRLLVLNGLTLDGAVLIDNAARLTFSRTQTFDNATVVFGGGAASGSLTATANSTLTLGPDMVVRGKNGTIGWPTSSGQVDFHLINEGLISADTAGGTLTINATQFTNNGTVEEINGGTLIIP